MSKFMICGLFAVAGVVGPIGAGHCFAKVPICDDRAVMLAIDDDEKKTEEKVEIDKLPAAVTDTVNKEVPGGKITEASKVTKKGKAYYEMDVKSGDTEFEIKTTEDGKFKSKKVEEDEKDDKK